MKKKFIELKSYITLQHKIINQKERKKMDTFKLFCEIRETNKRTLCELVSSLVKLTQQLENIKDEKERKEATRLILNSLMTVRMNILTL